MLTLIFGVWLNVAQIAYLEPVESIWAGSEDCLIVMAGPTYSYVGKTFKVGNTCDQVAAEINKAREVK